MPKTKFTLTVQAMSENIASEIGETLSDNKKRKLGRMLQRWLDDHTRQSRVEAAHMRAGLVAAQDSAKIVWMRIMSGQIEGKGASPYLDQIITDISDVLESPPAAHAPITKQ